MAARDERQGQLFAELEPVVDEMSAPVTLDAEALASYDVIYVAFSGGKDCLASLLHLLEMGVPRERIELHHHLVDGVGDPSMMDWPVTEAYCRAIAAHLGLPIYMSWKDGGYRREMLRDNAATAPTNFVTPEGTVRSVGGDSGKLNTRLRFPQQSASLTTRWCSSYLKSGVCAASITGQERFLGRRTLVVTGERAQESANRARYACFEPHRTDARAGRLRRHVDHYRPVHRWREPEVWAIIERWTIRPHPAYQAGFSRLSCALCVFGNADQWATVARALPEQFAEVRMHERNFGVTIHRSGKDVGVLAAQGAPYPAATPELLELARRTTYDLPILMVPWSLPAGAYGHSDAPP